MPFPARAGMNRPTGSRARTKETVPRTRGDEPIIEEALESYLDRSPHARG